MNKKKLKKYFKYFLKEIIPVVIGILIALFLNNWGEKRKEKKYYSQVFESIKKELSETRKDINTTLIQQQSLVDTLDFYIDNEKLTVYDVLIKADGIHAPKIRISTWKAVANTKIELIDFKSISMLTDIEETKEQLKRKHTILSEYLFSNIKDTSTNKKSMIKLFMEDIIRDEIWLKKDIDKFLK